MIKKTSANVALRGLTPPRMVNRGIHIGIEAVFAGRRFGPRRERRAFDKLDVVDGLDTLKSIFPGYDESQRRTVLVG